MKNNFIIVALCLLSFVFLLPACSKDNPANSGGGNAPSTLTPGRAAISLTTNPVYAGSTVFNVSNTVKTSALSSVVSGVRYINVWAQDGDSLNYRKVELDFELSPTASTAGGNIVASFAMPAGSAVGAALSLYSSTSLSVNESYFAQSGTCTITKLTATEIAGTFAALVKNSMNAETMAVSSGSFAGKFQ